MGTRELPRAASGDAPRFPFGGHPRGWFAIAFSQDVEPGALRRARYFGEELVIVRGASGSVFVTEAYCPHMGAHLGHGGTVEGDCVRCPYHAWRFDAAGRCVEVPYSDRIPPKARLRSWPVREQNGVIHVYHDPDGGAPTWQLPALEEDGWTEHRTVLWDGLRTHPQEVFENTVDIAHIAPVHDGKRAKVLDSAREGPVMRVRLEFLAPGAVVDMPDEWNDVELSVALYGVGYTVVNTHVRNHNVFARQRIYATPIDASTIDLRGVVQVRDTGDATFTDELGAIFYRAYVEDFARDFPIWENKRYLLRPNLAAGDGPIGLYRRWCAQFYPDEPVEKDRPTKRRPRARGLVRRVSGGVRATAERLSARGLALVTQLRAARPDANTTRDASSPATTAGRGPQGPRVASVREYFDTLGERFVADAARDVDAVFQWELAGDDGGTFHAEVRAGALSLHEGSHAAPTVVLVMAADDYVRMVNGELDGVRAFATGKGKIRGSVSAAMKMRALFPQA
ncbi:MAG: Rieske 2Fe-2S domain-containing protein [Nannocystaceae bacterium]|nr:Rieske 2Fe-2S domain-containing protein [Myxococcales bacterium]